MREKYQEPALVYIDEEYKNELDRLKEKYKDKPEHPINRLEAKLLYMFAILLSLRNEYKPKKSKKKAWILRTEYLKQDDRALIKSLVFTYSKDIQLLLPINYDKFYELSEELANAGMVDLIDLLNNPENIEETILIESKKFKSSH